jgi:hypothetical protein
MYNASNDNSENYSTMEEIINDYNLSGIDVLNYLVDWHGLDLLSKDFMENLIDCEL